MSLKYEDLIEKAEKKRQELLAEAKGFQAQLPLKYLRQQAHFTTPASNYEMVQKAVVSGMSATSKLLEKFGISHSELANLFEVSVADIEETLRGDHRSPFVMVDGEDAQALREDVVQRGRINSIKIFREVDWGRTLRFYRPSGLRLDFCVRDMYTVLTQVAEGLKPDQYPIDGIVWPKVEQPSQLQWVCDILSSIEKELKLPKNRIKLEFLVESGWGVVNLSDLVGVSLPRLAGIIFGIADYSADILLPDIENNHPVCDWARAHVVNMAGTIGVPAIDNMTVNYPVADKNLTPEQNKQRILSRLKECYEDAKHGQYLGMDGKWVGHPLQLFVVMLAYRTSLPKAAVEEEVHKIEAYQQAVEQELGATIIKGVMSDRATDRHARNKLRKAIAIGHLEPEKGVKFGLITEQEAAQLRSLIQSL
jgi:citrate lyase beta subunit